MAQYFRISPAYWAKLSDKEKHFFQVNACDYGVRNCKRVLTLANKFFPGWGEIDNTADLLRANGRARMAVLAINTWSVINDAGRPVGMIYKGENIGLCERVYFADESGKYVEIYNDITGIKRACKTDTKPIQNRYFEPLRRQNSRYIVKPYPCRIIPAGSKYPNKWTQNNYY